MKNKTVKRLCVNLLPSLQNYLCVDRMLLECPMHHIARGYYFESSGVDSNCFYLWSFLLPLYVPTKNIHFTFGRRIANEEGQLWSTSNPNIHEWLLKSILDNGSILLSDTLDPQTFANAVMRQTSSIFNPYIAQAASYSLVLARCFQSALLGLESLVSSLESSIIWQEEMRQRAIQLIEALRSDSNQALLLLRDWEQETISNLRLNTVPREV